MTRLAHFSPSSPVTRVVPLIKSFYHTRQELPSGGYFRDIQLPPSRLCHRQPSGPPPGDLASADTLLCGRAQG